MVEPFTGCSVTTAGLTSGEQTSGIATRPVTSAAGADCPVSSNIAGRKTRDRQCRFMGKLAAESTDDVEIQSQRVRL